jgi:hypothetical protein
VTTAKIEKERKKSFEIDFTEKDKGKVYPIAYH